jgi:carbamoyl-phosphate synthase large subunit
MTSAEPFRVLICSAGRRNYLVRWFREAFQLFPELDGKVLVADADAKAAAFADADAGFVLPQIDSPEYFPALESLCAGEGVRLGLSLNDYELMRWAAEAGSLPTEPVFLVPNHETLRIACDKAYLHECADGFLVPDTTTLAHVLKDPEVLDRFPESVIVKPRNGSASAHLRRLARDDLTHGLARSSSRADALALLQFSATYDPADVLVQAVVEGVEYGVDIVHDLRRAPAGVLVRQKLGMRAGETDRAVTVDATSFYETATAVGSQTRHTGPIDVDLIRDAAGRDWVLDVNPRFGGGYPFSHAAGANLPAALIAWVLGAPPRQEWLTSRANVLGGKVSTVVVLQDGIA